MGRKNGNARLRPRLFEKYEFTPETKPKVKLVMPEPDPELEPPARPYEQPISQGGGYRHRWMTREGVG